MEGILWVERVGEKKRGEGSRGMEEGKENRKKGRGGGGDIEGDGGRVKRYGLRWLGGVGEGEGVEGVKRKVEVMGERGEV